MTVRVTGWETYEAASHRGERIITQLVKQAKTEETAARWAANLWRRQGRTVREVKAEAIKAKRKETK